MEPRKTRHESTLEKHPDHVKAIGMITVEMANMEMYLGDLLGAVLHIGNYMARIVYLTPRSAFARLEILENVIDATLVPKTDARIHLEGICARAKAVMGKRHDLIHQAWGVSEANPQNIMRMRLPQFEGDTLQSAPLPELTQMITDIRNVIDDIKDAAEDGYRNWPPYTLPEKFAVLVRGAGDASNNPPIDQPPKPPHQPGS
jgi:hypothetical protein